MEKEILITVLERANDMLDFLKDMRANLLKDHERMINQQRRFQEQVEKRLQDLSDTASFQQQRYQSELKKISDLCQTMDETLCNVLLAVRQNEYLQAWYPAQNGQEEQRVIGKYVEVKEEEE